MPNPALLHEREMPYIDAIRSYFIQKNPKRLFALTDEAVKTLCIRVMTTMLIPERELPYIRPTFTEAVQSALKMTTMNHREFLIDFFNMPPDLPQEQADRIIPRDEVAMARMIHYLNAPENHSFFKEFKHLPDAVWGVWPTIIVWLYLLHYQKAKFTDYMAMGLSLSLHIVQLNRIPDNFENEWAALRIGNKE